MIAIIDYGAGNLKNVKHVLTLLDIEAFVTDEPSELKNANGIILPGVGAFGEAMKRLETKGFVEQINQQVNQGTPLLGICLGMQLLFDKSYEHGEHKGLGLIDGDIVRFSDDVKVPHMGWNQLDLKQTTVLNEGIQNGDYVYFVHSYYAKATYEADILHETTYGNSFTSAVKRGHVMGMQYHPEKSSRVGMQLLKNFGEMVR